MVLVSRSNSCRLLCCCCQLAFLTCSVLCIAAYYWSHVSCMRHLEESFVLCCRRLWHCDHDRGYYLPTAAWGPA